jgi:hypothetical protein
MLLILTTEKGPEIMNKFFAGLLLLSIFCASSAVGETVFGPNQYVRTSEGTTEFTDTFTAPAGEAMLYVENGEWDGDRRVDDQISSARILLNDVEIFGPSSFNQNVYILKSLVNLVAESTITVELNGSPDSYLTLRITRPKVTINADPEIILLGDSSTLSWDSSDVETCTIEPGIGPVAANGSITVSPTETTVYTITATDPVGIISSAFKGIRVNHVPVAEPQSVATDEDIHVPITLSGVDVDGDLLTFQVSSGPLNGILSGAPPNLVYTPNLNYNGSDSFTFIGNDGTQDSDQTTVAININPVNDAPVADAGIAQTVFRGDTVSLDGSGSNDVDEDPLFYQWSFVSVPTGSSATLSDSNAVIASFTPDLLGTFEVQLTVNDGTVDSVSNTVLITVNPRMVEVPGIIGLAQTEAETTIISSGLSVGLITSEHSDSVPEGNVISQNPGGGSLLEENSAIDFIVSLGTIDQPPTVTIAANPAIILAGSSSTLTWNSTNAFLCKFCNLTEDGPFEEVPLNGSTVVSPATTTTYLILALGPIEYTYATIKITVLDNPNQLSASLNASPDSILSGESSTLSWDTANAEHIFIDNGIGSVEKNGSTVVSPTETTTYTIIALGSDSMVYDSKRILVKPPPSVHIYASPESLLLGESVTLSWSTTEVDTCIIEPGAIDCNLSNGSTIVRPLVNTTYTITGTFAGGSVLDSVSVLFRPPTVSLTADNYYILSGQGVALSWETTNAESVSIDNGIGNVGVSNSINIFPPSTTTYTLTATGPGGTDIAAVTIKVLDADTLGVLFISPAEYDVIDIPQTQVTGMVVSYAGEVGVTVNGIPAQVSGNMFFVNNLPLIEGENTITATATEPDGSTASDTVTVYVDISNADERIELSVSPESGIAPLNATLRSDLHLTNPIQSSTITYDGTGEVTVTSVSDTEYELFFNTPGLYPITYTAIDDQGREFSQDIMVNVLDRMQLNTLLKSKWEGMKSALVEQDVEEGLTRFHIKSQPQYRNAFNAILGDLPQLFSNMQEIEMIYTKGNRAKHRINRLHDINGTPVTITYYIYFVRDANGLWKIEQF